MKKNPLFILIFLLLTRCGVNSNDLIETPQQAGIGLPEDQSNSDELGANDEIKNSDFLIEGPIFTVSYNEVFEQPNWIEYQVRDIVKVADRDGMEFYAVDSVHTSDNNDYYNNVWDRGHLVPAGSFTDSYENLYATFSFLNCTLQKDQLNRGQWNALENQARLWASAYGTLEVRIELAFDEGHQVLPTNAHIPSAYTKKITFPDGSRRCFTFPNKDTNQDWPAYEVDCN